VPEAAKTNDYPLGAEKNEKEKRNGVETERTDSQEEACRDRNKAAYHKEPECYWAETATQREKNQNANRSKEGYPEGFASARENTGKQERKKKNKHHKTE
jgi:hypothetical protein